MSIEYLQKLPSVEELLKENSLPANLKEVKDKRDQEIKNLFSGKDDRFLLIIGPCSAHNEDAVCEYVTRLAATAEKVKDKILIIPRIYTNKPRTTGLGYKGMLHQPDHQKKPDMIKGLNAIRHMHVRAISESYLTAADEMLYPGNYPFLEDLLSYVAIGARSVENQQHRLTVSGLDIPAGMKNPTSGDIKVMLDSIMAAQNSHVFVYNNWEVSTTGNEFAHAILRGSVDLYGNHVPNYHYEDLISVVNSYKKRNFDNPAIIVDTNHSNSMKKYSEQPRIINEVLQSMDHCCDLKKMIKGFMIESYLLEGSQDPLGDEFGKSITDPCLGWEDSERLIFDIAEKL